MTEERIDYQWMAQAQMKGSSLEALRSGVDGTCSQASSGFFHHVAVHSSALLCPSLLVVSLIIPFNFHSVTFIQSLYLSFFHNPFFILLYILSPASFRSPSLSFHLSFLSFLTSSLPYIWMKRFILVLSWSEWLSVCSLAWSVWWFIVAALRSWPLLRLERWISVRDKRTRIQMNDKLIRECQNKCAKYEIDCDALHFKDLITLRLSDKIPD